VFKTFCDIKIPDSFTDLLQQHIPQGSRIGKLKFPKGGEGDDITLLEKSLFLYEQRLNDICRELGVEVIQVDVDGSDLIELIDMVTIVKGKFKIDLEAYLATRPRCQVKTLTQLIKFNEKQKPHYPQTTLTDFAEMNTQFNETYSKVLGYKADIEKRVDLLFKDNRLDFLWGTIPAITAWLGYPSITFPFDVDEETKLPVGISFMGTRYSDGRLLVLGYAFEQALKKKGLGRKKPTYQHSTTESTSTEKSKKKK
jgi:amidase